MKPLQMCRTCKNSTLKVITTATIMKMQCDGCGLDLTRLNGGRYKGVFRGTTKYKFTIDGLTPILDVSSAVRQS